MSGLAAPTSSAARWISRYPLGAASTLCLVVYAVIFFLPGGGATKDPGAEQPSEASPDSKEEPATSPESVQPIEAPPAEQQQAVAAEARTVPGVRVLVQNEGLSYPYALVVTAEGGLIVADARNHRLVLFDASGRKLESWGEEGTAPGEFGAIEDVAVGPDGSIYVLESKPSRIQRLRADGRPDAVVAEGGWCAPNGLDVDERGRMYIAETCGNKILQLDASGAVERSFTGGTDGASRLEQPLDVVVAKGDLFVADLHRRIARIDGQSDQIVAAWPVQVGGAVASSSVARSGGLLYVTDPDRHVIYRVDTDAGSVRTLGGHGSGPGEFTTPLGIALGRGGEVYVGDGETGRIQVFTRFAD